MNGDFSVYLTGLKKKWKGGLLPSIGIILLGLMMVAIWPEFEGQIEAFEEILESDLYVVMMGEGLVSMGMTSFKGFYAAEMFTVVMYFVIFIPVFQAGAIISKEAEEGTLDVIFSYPIKRWSFLLQRFGVYATFVLIYPMFIFLGGVFGAALLHESMDVTGLFYSQIGSYLHFITGGAIALLCSVLILDPDKSRGTAAGILVSSYLIEGFGQIVDSIKWMRDFSIYHYANPGTILAEGSLPYSDILLLLLLSAVCLLISLYVVEKREYAA